MKIVLVSLPASDTKESRSKIPLPLLCIAAYVRKTGHEPVIVDLFLHTPVSGKDPMDYYAEIVIKSIKENKPGLLGINCFTMIQFPVLREIMQRVRKVFPSLPSIIGGAHPTMFADDIINNCSEIDYIAIGEGELQIAALADMIEKNDYSNIASVQSFAYRVNGKAVVNPRIDYIQDLDSLPMPTWDLVDFSQYHGDHSKWFNPKNKDITIAAPVVSSRSCPYRCSFCGVDKLMGSKYRTKSPKVVVDEIEYLYKKKGVNYFAFIDDNIAVNKKHLTELCDEIRNRKLDILFSISQGLFLRNVDEEVVDMLAKTGLATVTFPIEHGDAHIRNDIIGKNVQDEQIYRVVEIFKKYNVFTLAAFIMGFPEETNETLQKTYDMIQRLSIDINYVFPLIPLPGTKVFEQVKRDNLFTYSFDASTTWQGHEDINGLRADQFYIKPYNMELTELFEWRQRFEKLKYYSERARALNL
ncbi:MAG: radical SAM protein [Fibrobacteres bacterium]|nr:radical SAM protein [Fibrobacterota bacterium]